MEDTKLLLESIDSKLEKISSILESIENLIVRNRAGQLVREAKS